MTEDAAVLEEMARRGYYRTRDGETVESPTRLGEARVLMPDEMAAMPPDMVITAKYYSAKSGGVARHRLKVGAVVLTIRKEVGMTHQEQWARLTKKQREFALASTMGILFYTHDDKMRGFVRGTFDDMPPKVQTEIGRYFDFRASEEGRDWASASGKSPEIRCPDCSSTRFTHNPTEGSDYICQECGQWFDKGVSQRRVRAKRRTTARPRLSR